MPQKQILLFMAPKLPFTLIIKVLVVNLDTFDTASDLVVSLFVTVCM